MEVWAPWTHCFTILQPKYHYLCPSIGEKTIIGMNFDGILTIYGILNDSWWVTLYLSWVTGTCNEFEVFKTSDLNLQLTYDISTWTCRSHTHRSNAGSGQVGSWLDLNLYLALVLRFWSRVRWTWVEGFGEVIDQRSGTLLVPSTCRRTERTEFQSSGLRQIGWSIEYRGQRSKVRSQM